MKPVRITVKLGTRGQKLLAVCVGLARPGFPSGRAALVQTVAEKPRLRVVPGAERSGCREEAVNTLNDSLRRGLCLRAG